MHNCDCGTQCMAGVQPTEHAGCNEGIIVTPRQFRPSAAPILQCLVNILVRGCSQLPRQEAHVVSAEKRAFFFLFLHIGEAEDNCKCPEGWLQTDMHAIDVHAPN